MRTIGLLGGMSSESTALYYKTITCQIRARLGGLHSGKLLVHSLDFAPIEKLQRQGKWQQAADIILDGIRTLSDGHADFCLICSVTGQRDWDYLQEQSPIPLLCARNAVLESVIELGKSHVGLLGTTYTMEQPFFKDMLSKAGITVHIPDSNDRERIQSIIYNELCIGVIRDDSRAFLYKILNAWKAHGIGAAILGCTELPLLFTQMGHPLPLFDVVQIHVTRAIEKVFDL